jgi:hypothetical protein
VIKNSFRVPAVTALLVLSLGQSSLTFAQGDEYEEARNMVQKVQTDLHSLNPTAAKDRGRIDDALKHLSDLDRNFTKDKYKKGPLSDAIGNIEGILDHNTLETRERDMLNADVHDLRELRLYKGR